MILIVTLFFALSVSTRFTEATDACSWAKRDVVFILDESESISDNELRIAKHFIIRMMSFVVKSNRENRIALILFGDEAKLAFNLNKHTNMKEMIKDLMRERQSNSLTAIGKALRLTLQKVVPVMRNDANRIIVLLTDGSNNVYPSPHFYAERLKDTSVQIMSLGIGSSINWRELQAISSPNMAMRVDNIHGLAKIKQQIVNQFCVIVDPVPLKPCRVEKQDLVILLDASDSITHSEYENAKLFLVNLLKNFQIGHDKTRVGMISFSDETRIDFDFNLRDKNKIIETIRSLKKFGSNTAIGLALKETLLKFKPLRRPDVPFNILLITDGFNNVFPKPKETADLLKKGGANIVTLGIGANIKLDELKDISSNGKILTVDSFKELQSNLKTVLKTVICGR